jgi:hemoglobin
MTWPSLYERVGGDSAVAPAVALFYRRVQDDPVLAPYFAGVDMPRLQAHQRAFLAAALGGPELFAGRPIEVAHAGLQIDDLAFDAMVDQLICALRDLGLDVDTAAQVATELEHLRSKIVSQGRAEQAGG